jgi:hypothetical protein
LPPWYVLKVYYEYASRFERWRRGTPLTHAEVIEEQKRQAAEDAGA